MWINAPDASRPCSPTSEYRDERGTVPTYYLLNVQQIIGDMEALPEDLREKLLSAWAAHKKSGDNLSTVKK